MSTIFLAFVHSESICQSYMPVLQLIPLAATMTAPQLPDCLPSWPCKVKVFFCIFAKVCAFRFISSVAFFNFTFFFALVSYEDFYCFGFSRYLQILCILSTFWHVSGAYNMLRDGIKSCQDQAVYTDSQANKHTLSKRQAALRQLQAPMPPSNCSSSSSSKLVLAWHGIYCLFSNCLPFQTIRKG